MVKQTSKPTSKPSVPELSLIITAHGEGILTHRTLRSALRACELLDTQSITWEIQIHIDNATPETREYLAANRDFLAPFPIFHNSFKDLSASRNFMVPKARGKVIAFLDADDLISGNWLADGVTFLRNFGKPAVLHTEYLINFGKQQLVWRKYDSRSREEDALIMVWANRWDSAVMAPREVFEAHPYAPNTHGYGSEDWHFGSQTLAAGIPHRVVPETVLFARRRDSSEMSIQSSDFRTVHYTDLLDIGFFKAIDPAAVLAGKQAAAPVAAPRAFDTVKRLTKRTAIQAYQLAVTMPALRPYAEGAKNRLKATRHSPDTSAERFPRWLTDEWRAMHAIDKQIFPDRELLKTIPLYVSEMYELGVAYRNLLQTVRRRPDYIIIVPHLVPGGADLVVLNYVEALRKLHPDWQLLVIATDDTVSPWADKLPEAVDFMHWGRICRESGIWLDLHLQLFARLIVQLQCKRLHIIQSSLGFQFAEKYRRLLTENDYQVFACAFCEDIDDEGRFIGHLHSGLPGAYPAISRILTDNQAVVTQLAHEYAMDEKRFAVHYQPAEIGRLEPPKAVVHKPYRILWASRVSTQKRPDIAKAIAQKLDPADFHIDMYGSLHNDFTAEYFDHVPALTYKGGFNGVESINTKQYDMFLYTSANDGVPNILLGMTAAGLPIVASNAGGVGEFIQNQQTGRLISKLDDIDAYVAAITALRDDPAEAAGYVRAAQKLLQSRHSRTSFEHAVKEILP